MFERYSETARRAIFFARYEASVFGSPEIEPHHLLLGLLRGAWDVFDPFLKARSEIERIRQELTERLAQRADIPTSVDLPLSHEGKRVLAYAAEEAERLRHPNIEAVHLVLALLRIENGVVAGILSRYGMELGRMREAVARKPLFHGTISDEALARAQGALSTLAPDRLAAAQRVVEALAHNPVITITIKTPDGSSTIPFNRPDGEPRAAPPAADG